MRKIIVTFLAVPLSFSTIEQVVSGKDEEIGCNTLVSAISVQAGVPNGIQRMLLHNLNQIVSNNWIGAVERFMDLKMKIFSTAPIHFGYEFELNFLRLKQNLLIFMQQSIGNVHYMKN
jgi:hypothetical protein